MAIASFPMLNAQEPASKKPRVSARHSKPSPAAAAQAAPEATMPPEPAWPVNEPARQAHITWDSHGLKIEANNSSLQQILHEVSTLTGAKVEGANKDERIFGTYGPGPSREVISRLLDGTDYNVVMLGGQGGAPPTKIMLSTASPAGPQQTAGGPQVQQGDEDVEAEEPQPEPQPMPQPMPQQMPPQQGPQPMPIRNPFGGAPQPGSMPPMPPQMPPDQQQQQNNQQR